MLMPVSALQDHAAPPCFLHAVAAVLLQAAAADPGHVGSHLAPPGCWQALLDLLQPEQAVQRCQAHLACARQLGLQRGRGGEAHLLPGTGSTLQGAAAAGPLLGTPARLQSLADLWQHGPSAMGAAAAVARLVTLLVQSQGATVTEDDLLQQQSLPALLACYAAHAAAALLRPPGVAQTWQAAAWRQRQLMVQHAAEAGAHRPLFWCWPLGASLCQCNDTCCAPAGNAILLGVQLDAEQQKRAVPCRLVVAAAAVHAHGTAAGHALQMASCKLLTTLLAERGLAEICLLDAEGKRGPGCPQAAWMLACPPPA